MLSDSEIKAHFAEIDAMSPAERERHMRDVEQRLSPATKEHLPFLVRYAEDKTIEKFKKVLEDMVTEKRSKQVTKRFEPKGDDTDVKVINKIVNKPYSTGGNITVRNIEHDFSSFGHFVKDVVKVAIQGYETPELRDWRVKTAGTMEEGDLAQGGMLVPLEFSASLLSRSLETAIVRPRAYYQPMATSRIEIPAQVDENHSSSLFGGVTIYRPGEGGEKTASNPTFGKIGLTLHKLVGLVKVTDELIEDSPQAIGAYLSKVFPEAISFTEDSDFLTGSGANQALGAFNATNPSLITVDAVGGQGANTITAENCFAIWARLHPSCQRNAVWLANPECFPQIATMALSVGTGGIPVFLPANNMSETPYSSLMGRPLIWSEKMAALGTAGDIGLADFSAYVIGGKGDGTPQMASSIHLLFNFDETVFRFVLRYDGQPLWLSPVTPQHGTSTLSPFIRLSGTRT